MDETYVKEDRTDKRVKTLKLSHHVGGTQDCVLVHDGIWYLGFGQELQVLEGRGKKPLRSDRINHSGEGGSITDLALWHGDLIGLVDGDAVVRWDISSRSNSQLLARN